jgi:hypothetical protein
LDRNRADKKIFHFSFSISHLSSGERTLLEMTNEKCQMRNGKLVSCPKNQTCQGIRLR